MEGQRPTIKGLRAAPYLPVAEIEPRHDDPIVIPAGTWVGVVNADNTASVQGVTGSIAFTKMDLVPACSHWYTVTYSANDISDTFGTLGNVREYDTYSYVLGASQTGATVTAAGASTLKVGQTGVGIKPLGIAYTDIYASWLADAYTNYDRQPVIGFLSQMQVVQVPAQTPQEKAIEVGDKVMIDGYGSNTMTWAPATPNTGVSERVGRLRAVTDVTTGDVQTQAEFTEATGSAAAIVAVVEALKINEFVVGKCVRKILVADYASATENTTLASNVSSITRSNVSSEFSDAGRVQTVPGLSLQGSGLQGVPAWARTSTADSAGKFWILEISVAAV